MKDINYHGLLGDIVYELMKQMSDARGSFQENPDDYNSGMLYGYYEVLSLIYQEILAFGGQPSDIGMNNFDPDRDVLLPVKRAPTDSF